MRENTTVIAVTQNSSIRMTVQEALWEAGYQVITSSKTAALFRVRETPPDLALLEMTDELTDQSFIERISQGGTIPVVFMAPKEAWDVARAFRMGGADCIMNPKEEGETAARVREALRRWNWRDNPRTIEINGLEINRGTRGAKLAGKPIAMTATEFNLLWELAHNAGRVMTYDTLITRVWDDESIYDTGALRKVVKNLRAKLGDNAPEPGLDLHPAQGGLPPRQVKAA